MIVAREFCPICGKEAVDGESIVSDPDKPTSRQHRCKESTLAARDRAMKYERCEAERDRRSFNGRLRDAEAFRNGRP